MTNQHPITCPYHSRRAELATPPPEPPTDEELQALWHELFSHDDTVSSGDVEVIARAVLEKWGNKKQ